MPEVEVWTTVDVELDDFADEDLIEELDKRGKGMEVASQTDSKWHNFRFCRCRAVITLQASFILKLNLKMMLNTLSR